MSVRADAPGVARAFDSPFVGRRDEIGALRIALDVARTERRCRLVALVGNAGIGKTRIAREFVESSRTRVYWSGAASRTATARRTSRWSTPCETCCRARASARGRRHGSHRRTRQRQRDARYRGRHRRAVRRRREPRARASARGDLRRRSWAEPTFLDLVEYLGAWTDDARFFCSRSHARTCSTNGRPGQTPRSASRP